MEKFSSFLNEQKDVPYELLIVSHDGIDDVNETGPLIHRTAKKMGIKSSRDNIKKNKALDVEKKYKSYAQKPGMI